MALRHLHRTCASYFTFCVHGQPGYISILPQLYAASRRPKNLVESSCSIGLWRVYACAEFLLIGFIRMTLLRSSAASDTCMLQQPRRSTLRAAAKSELDKIQEMLQLNRVILRVLLMRDCQRTECPHSMLLRDCCATMH